LVVVLTQFVYAPIRLQEFRMNDYKSLISESIALHYIKI